ncbi:MAG: fibro-slime domain-containing protein [Lachnospiraceae bacterium]|nr:fibro-slime domain-containing protein [Lachnospiraceae bacterium]
MGKLIEKKSGWKHRILAVSLSVFVMASYLSDVFLAFAAPADNDGLCEHHQEHTEECGYQEGLESSPCLYDCELCKSEEEAESQNSDGEMPTGESPDHETAEGETQSAETTGGVSETETIETETMETETTETDSIFLQEQGISETYGAGTAIKAWSWEDGGNGQDQLLAWNEGNRRWEAVVHMDVTDQSGNSLTKEGVENVLLQVLPSCITATMEDGGKKSVAVTWDFSFSGFSSGDLMQVGKTVSVLAKGELPSGYTLGSGRTLDVKLEACGPRKFLNNWKFVPRDETALEEKPDGTWSLELYSTSLEPEKIREAVEKVLPEKISCQAYAPLPTSPFAWWDHGFTQEKTVGNIVYGFLEVHWLLNRLDTMDFQDGKSYTIWAEYDTLWGVNGSGGLIRTYLPLDITIHFMDLDKYVVTKGISDPEGATVNLFDYWVEDTGKKPTAAQGGDLLPNSDFHYRYVNPDGTGGLSSTPIGFSDERDWNKGINAGHLLIFGDGVVHAGLWNKGAGGDTVYGKNYAGMEKIVKPTLSHDGYPLINTELAKSQMTGDGSRDYKTIRDYLLAGDCDGTSNYDGSNIWNLSNKVIASWERGQGKTLGMDEESLNYLFDPSVSHPNKTSYKNVTGLFQVDEEGYYYYNMRNNFAEFVQEKNGDSDGHFKLYKHAATLRTDGKNGEISIGNFFPFNTGEEVFTGINDQGALTSAVKCSGNSMNHHLGMTVSIDFRQPVNGRINMGSSGNKPMSFEFAGDDDVWVFIDDVLVLDLGGVHSEIYGTINFETGEVYIGRAFNEKKIPSDPSGPDMVTATTIKKLFEEAGQADKTAWKGETFASNSDHTLRMFYLERGNYDSSIALRFNLQPRLYQQIKKVDHDGNPVRGVGFTMYEAVRTGEGYAATGNALASLMTDQDGVARFTEVDSDGTLRPFNFADRYAEGISAYILKETSTPPGYRSLPEDIVLTYDVDTTLLTVVNRWTTGAYANFTETITGNNKITYGSFDRNTGNIAAGDRQVETATQKDGLVVAIPMLYQRETKRWQALYGSNTDGLHTVTPKGQDTQDWDRAVLEALVRQCADGRNSTPHWYLEWDDETNRLEGFLSDLPGRADRYQLNNTGDSDMKMVYAMIAPEVFHSLHIEAGDSRSRYAALGNYINGCLQGGKSITDVVEEIYGISSPSVGRGLSFLNVDQFIRIFRSVIYVPNERRELRVWKVDQDGKGVNGTRFGLYTSAACTGTPVASGVTATVEGRDGVLVFTPHDSGFPGHANMEWDRSANTRYYLKEISAPPGYQVNPNVVSVVVGVHSIYADAGIDDDGITVMAGVGKLAQTLTKYAADEEVEITLRDITAFAQGQRSDAFSLDGWEDTMLAGTSVPRSMNLHYGMNVAAGYGLHDEDGGETLQPFFVTDEGFIRVRVKQNYRALTGEMYGSSGIDTNKENLGNTDITSLFSLLNIVVVTDQTKADSKTGELMVSKMVRGDGLTEADYTRLYPFALTLTDARGRELGGEYYFYGTNKAGYIKSGGIIPLHHDESVTVLGLPEGTRYHVREASLSGWYSIPTTGEAAGNILSGERAAAFFTNTNIRPESGEMTLQKTVTGAGNTRRNFNFEVKFVGEDGKELAGSYPYMGSKVGTISSGDTVQLRHNENLMVMELPVGAHYRVTEKEADQNGYTTKAIGDSGDIFYDRESRAEFINDRETKEKTAPGSETENGKKNATGALDTGDHTPLYAWWWAFGVSLTVLASICYTCEKQRRRAWKKKSFDL